MLLVDQLVKSTWLTHKDVPPLKGALVSIKEIAQIVDSRTAEAERVQKITEIEESISGKFETLREANRRFVMEGELILITVGKVLFCFLSFFLFIVVVVVVVVMIIIIFGGS